MKKGYEEGEDFENRGDPTKKRRERPGNAKRALRDLYKR